MDRICPHRQRDILVRLRLSGIPVQLQDAHRVYCRYGNFVASSRVVYDGQDWLRTM